MSARKAMCRRNSSWLDGSPFLEAAVALMAIVLALEAYLVTNLVRLFAWNAFDSCPDTGVA